MRVRYPDFFLFTHVQVEKGVALKIRLELTRLRAERPKHQQKEVEEKGASAGVAADLYYPDGYGRDDPYRGDEELQRERAAQQAAIEAFIPALTPAPNDHERRSVADSSLENSSPAPKARAPLKEDQHDYIQEQKQSREKEDAQARR